MQDLSIFCLSFPGTLNNLVQKFCFPGEFLKIHFEEDCESSLAICFLRFYFVNQRSIRTMKRFPNSRHGNCILQKITKWTLQRYSFSVIIWCSDQQSLWFIFEETKKKLPKFLQWHCYWDIIGNNLLTIGKWGMRCI